ncbi:MAG: hypothetical protein LBS57_01795 [Treponema sp.]|jgi:hypothetical protein|nr:hypothetical protein [Treponema sp.]
MNISINGKKADLTLESEKTAGEILAGLEQWLENSGHRLSGLVIDGETIPAGGLADSFNRDIASIGSLDIKTNTLPELAAIALINAAEDLVEYESAGFEEKQEIAGKWEESPQAGLLAEQMPEIHDWILKTLSGEGPGVPGMRNMIEERLHELQDPLAELDRAGPLVAEIIRRLEDFPLDIQTGKDARAVDTIRLFSNVTEKIFRLFNLLKVEGFPVGNIKVDETPISDYITEFGSTLKELLEAYEQKDAVLVGDLAEYELAPRLRSLYAAIKTPAASSA